MISIKSIFGKSRRLSVTFEPCRLPVYGMYVCLFTCLPVVLSVGLERAQLIFLICHTFVCKFGRVEGAARETNYRQMHEKLEKLTERLLSNQHSSNLVNTNFYLVF